MSAPLFFFHLPALNPCLHIGQPIHFGHADEFAHIVGRLAEGKPRGCGLAGKAYAPRNKRSM